MGAKYLYLHECEKPSMIVGHRTVERSKGWWIFKKRWTETGPLYERRTVRWTCECGTVWDWLVMSEPDGGFWMCRERNEVWKDYDAG